MLTNAELGKKFHECLPAGRLFKCGLLLRLRRWFQRGTHKSSAHYVPEHPHPARDAMVLHYRMRFREAYETAKTLRSEHGPEAPAVARAKADACIVEGDPKLRQDWLRVARLAEDQGRPST